MQGRGQVLAQPFTGHLQDVVDAGLARSRFQVKSGAAVQIKDIALAIDERSDRGDLFQQRLFGQLAQRQFTGNGVFPAACGNTGSICRQGGRNRPRARAERP